MTDRPTGAGSFTRWERGEVHWVGVALLSGCCNGAGCCRLPGKALQQAGAPVTIHNP